MTIDGSAPREGLVGLYVVPTVSSVTDRTDGCDGSGTAKPAQLLRNASAGDDCGQSVHSAERQLTDRWVVERLKATVLLCGPHFPVPPPKRLRGLFGVQQIGIQCQAVERHVIPFNSVPGHQVVRQSTRHAARQPGLVPRNSSTGAVACVNEAPDSRDHKPARCSLVIAPSR